MQKYQITQQRGFAGRKDFFTIQTRKTGYFLSDYTGDSLRFRTEKAAKKFIRNYCKWIDKYFKK